MEEPLTSDLISGIAVEFELVLALVYGFFEFAYTFKNNFYLFNKINYCLMFYVVFLIILPDVHIHFRYNFRNRIVTLLLLYY